MAPIGLARGFMTVGLWTLLSRIFGFIRDILIAAWMGTGPVAEAFLVAFALPNMFRRFFAEGAFNMAFVPMFSKKLQAGEGAQSFARDAFAGLAAILILFTILATIFMPWLVLAMASGFVGDPRFEMTVTLGRIVFVYILFISLAALLSGVLNASGRFIAAAAAPVLLNIILIGTMIGVETGVITGTFINPAQDGAAFGSALAVGVVVAGIAQLALVWWAAARAGFPLRPKRPVWTPELKRLAVIAAPAALAGGVVQVNLLVGRQVASFFDSAIAWLSYADRLYQLPLGVVGIAIGIVLLPDLSRRLQAEDTAGGKNAFNRAGEMSLALAVPSAVALLVIPVTLVEVLFQRGAFGADDTAATALACAIYGLGLPAFVLQKVVQPLYFAREDTKRPFLYALVALFVNAGVAIGLAPVIGFMAAAIGTTIAGWAMLFLLWRGSRAMGDAAVTDERFRKRVWRIVGASAVMGAALWVGQFTLSPLIETPGLKFVGLAILVSIGIAVYATVGLAIGAFQKSDLKAAFRR
ncbi:murein biosynthesis integral membrane protein MurJ [Alphaproteobacteria bacterium GH1-50]|uniref:Probable lipid II flippase MurJ n=1 Tax=Kangsaoukella pontilimi TaxID=2691042 RepID=A0A7C9IGX8_9RHOB|nr:murein biosynthesis integral membrane protein MurJ [Kangsaoukella pontilimi]MXQ08628.1 murein biosynthesis integral membrane protein MurJ [Kangsaoukella pontilimi]